MRNLTIAVLILLVAPLALAAPKAGNGNKIVGYDSGYDIPIDCDFDGIGDLTLDYEGWFQGHVFDQTNNRNIELIVFHFDVTYTNAQGDTWTWRDRGPDRYYEVVNNDGVAELHWAVSGRSGWNIIGHAVFNLDTGELVLMTGYQPFGGEFGEATSDDLACEILF